MRPFISPTQIDYRPVYSNDIKYVIFFYMRILVESFIIHTESCSRSRPRERNEKVVIFQVNYNEIDDSNNQNLFG